MTLENSNLFDSLSTQKRRKSKKSRRESMGGATTVAAPARNSNYRELFQRIQRRNGEIADFSKSKITEAIWKAARSVGGSDRRTADLLADKVILFLSRTHDDHLLTIEEVQDAVEKVLIENGHARTAKSFILYREERARVRKFRQGTKAQTDSPRLPEPTGQGVVEVLTSSEQLARWNRERITHALVRETGLSLTVADRISREVEKQIIYSKTSRLTASLVREMVNVKLLEYGYSEERQRHSRLGVPLYDIEQMIQGRSEKSVSGQIERALAGDILRQYSLSRILSNEVAEAHLRGDLHIHNLTEPWRVIESVQSLEYLKKSGLCLPEFASRWTSAQSAEELIMQLGHFNARLKEAITGRTLWDGVNVFLAPLLEGKSDAEMQAVARSLLFQLSSRSPQMHSQEPLFSLGFYLHIPKSLWKTAALGPGGKYTGKTYAYYEETARRFLWIYLQTQAAGDCESQPFVAPEFCVHLDGACFEGEQSDEDLKKLESYLPKMGRWCAWYHGVKTAERTSNHFCAPESAGLEGARYTYPWKMRSSVGSAVTINLPALAVQAEGDAKELDMLLEQQVHLAFTAFRQHRQFLESFSEAGLETPFPRFDHRSDGEPFFRPGQQRCRVALWGLEEMAAWHSELSFAGKNTWQDLAREFLQQAVQKIELTAQSCRMACEVTLEGDSEVGKILEQRLSGQPRPKASSRSRSGKNNDRIFEPSEWVEILTMPYEEVLTPAELTVQQGECSLAGVLSAFNEQGVDYRLVVVQPFWLCQACSRLIAGTPDICPRCGSLQLVSMDL